MCGSVVITKVAQSLRSVVGMGFLMLFRIFSFVVLLVLALISMPSFGEDVADPRLEQLITIESTDARLHKVLEEISEKTGVRVYAGSNSKDWAVRDIPVVVCAKDVPLGKLLKAIAESAHLIFSSETAGDKKVYRIWRDKKTERAISDYFSARRKAAFEIAKWNWDAAARFKDISQSAFDIPKNDIWSRKMLADSFAKEVSRLISLLGVDVRDRVLAGERVHLKLSESSGVMKSAISDFLRASWQNSYANSLPYSEEWSIPTQDDYSAAVITIAASGVGSSSRDINSVPSVYINVSGQVPFSGYSIDTLASLVRRAKDTGLSNPPEMPKLPDVEQSDFSGDFWKKKISLEMPKDKKPLTYADLAVAIAKAAGCAIVFEDYHSHKYEANTESHFVKDVPLSSALFANWHIAWKLDSESGIIIGRDRDWIGCQSKLIPESLLNRLQELVDGSGAMLDDVTPLANYDEQAQMEWITQSRRLSCLGMPFSGDDRQLWAFYDSLTPQGKAQARSDTGLPLAVFNLEALSAIFAERNRARDLGYDNLDDPEYAAKRRYWEIPSDPMLIAGFVLRVRSNEYEVQAGRKVAYYNMEISGDREGGRFSVTLSGPGMQFPVYSPKRIEELFKKIN